jgi:uncharacterized protein HemX
VDTIFFRNPSSPFFYKKSQENQPTMSNVPTSPPAQMTDPTSHTAQMNSAAVIVFAIAFGGCAMIIIFAIMREKRAFHRAQAEASMTSQESREEIKRIRKEFILNG